MFGKYLAVADGDSGLLMLQLNNLYVGDYTKNPYFEIKETDTQPVGPTSTHYITVADRCQQKFVQWRSDDNFYRTFRFKASSVTKIMLTSVMLKNDGLAFDGWSDWSHYTIDIEASAVKI